MRYGANYSFFTVFLSWEKEVDVGPVLLQALY